nr:hypothetical protein [Sphaerochaetaceae bacterium]
AVCLVLTKTFPSFLKSFGRYSDYSLPIYLLNGYWLVLSREFAVHVLKTQSPALIIVINTVVDFYVSYLFIKYVMARIPVVRTVSGIKPPQNSKTA